MDRILFKKIKYLFLPVLLISVLFLFIPDLTYGLLPVKDYTGSALDGLEEIVGPIATNLINILFVYTVTLAFLAVITIIFDKVIRLNLEHLAVDTELVTTGFAFTSGIANMALILILIYLAFTIILKIESVNAEKILPELIIVALLLNFSLVFIGMLIDITNIIYNTLLPPEDNLFWIIMNPFIVNATISISGLITSITALAASFMIPIKNTIFQFALVAALPPTLLIVINLVLQIFIFGILSPLFLLFTSIFAARIFIIQILAIVAPIAIMCLILPKTKKYFDDWLKWLLEWLFVGIFLLFFLRLGFLIFGKFHKHIDAGIPLIGSLAGWFIFYLFIAIYLGLLAYLAKKYMPELAQVAIDQVQGLTKTAWSSGIAPALKSTQKQMDVEGKKQKASQKIGGRISKLGEKLEGKKGLGRLGAYTKRVGDIMTMSSKESAQKTGDEDKIYCKGKSKEHLVQIIETGGTTDSKKIAAINQLHADGNSDAITMKDKEIIELYKRNSALETDGIKDLAANYIHLHEELGITKEVPSTDTVSDTEEITDIKENNKKELEKVIKRRLRNSPGSMNANILEDEQILRAVLENINSSQINRAINADNTDFVNKISEKLKEKADEDPKTLKEILDINHSLRNHIKSGMAEQTMGINKDFLDDLKPKKNDYDPAYG